MTLFWSVERPSKVYAHRSMGQASINVREDLGWMEHALLKIIQMHQYPTHQVQEVELYDDQDVLRQGGGDGGVPPEDDHYGPGPEIESIHTDPADLPVPDGDVDDPIEVPVPDGDTDIDIDDDDFWTYWMDEIRADEFPFVEEIQKQRTVTHSWHPETSATQEDAQQPRATPESRECENDDSWSVWDP